MAHMNPYVVSYEPKSYAGSGGQICLVDCSLGVNMDPLPDRVIQKLDSLSEDHLKHYPHEESVVEYILKKFDGEAHIDRENIILGCGSFDILTNLDGLFINTEKTVVGYAPQFSAYVDDIHLRGAKYVALPLKKEWNRYRLDIDALIQLIKEVKPDLIYIDNPNNPTGQATAQNDIQDIVEAAREADAAIIVDEAYGDYMYPNYTAVPLVEKYDHLIVTKTMSKGYGMAGMRMGYAIGPKAIMKQLRKLLVPFNCNGLARDLAIAMLDGEDYIQSLAHDTRLKKVKLLETIQKDSVKNKIKVATTSITVPISLLYTEDESIDLYKVLADVGIATVSGASFDNLGINSVRLMLPRADEMELLCALIEKAAATIP